MDTSREEAALLLSVAKAAAERMASSSLMAGCRPEILLGAGLSPALVRALCEEADAKVEQQVSSCLGGLVRIYAGRTSHEGVAIRWQGSVQVQVVEEVAHG